MNTRLRRSPLLCFVLALGLTVPYSLLAAPRRIIPKKKPEKVLIVRSKIGSECLEAQVLARQDITREGFGKSGFGTGCILGGLLGLIGTLIATGSERADDPPARLIPDDATPAWTRCYTETFRSETKRKKTGNAILGSLLGTGFTVMIILIARSGGNDIDD